MLPPAGDAPAHLYRTLLVEQGAALWDNLWYAGQYPLASYSLLYYLPAAVVGNVPLVAAAAIVSAVLFASLVVHEWGEVARWPARAFALLAAIPLFTGTYTYALGLAAVLGSLRALQAGRPWLAVACAALTLGFSPLAFLFLCLGLLAVLVVRHRLGPRTLGIGAGVAVIAGAGVAVMVLFPSGGIYPFNLWGLLAVVTVSSLGTLLALRARRGGALAAFFGLWALASLVAFLVPSPVGDNLTRLRSLVFPLMLLTALLARFRPRWLAGAALAVALAYNVVPYGAAVVVRSDGRPAEASFWTPALAFLRERWEPGYRVEVVPTLDHWEAYWVPRAGFPLARGWYRQLDIAQNPVFYRQTLEPEAYRAWLRGLGVRYVLLPSTRLGPMGAKEEAELLRSGRSGLLEVFRSRDWTIYELPGAVPILTGPGQAGITAFGHERIRGWATASGVHLLRVRYTPYWRVEAGDLCVERATSGMTLLRVGSPGPFALTVSLAGDGDRC